jgi:hypothetical protein
MTILVFKTDIHFKKDIKRIEPVLNAHPAIFKWNIDTNDIDNVLRVESAAGNPATVIDLINEKGYFCEELPD